MIRLLFGGISVTPPTGTSIVVRRKAVPLLLDGLSSPPLDVPAAYPSPATSSPFGSLSAVVPSSSSIAAAKGDHNYSQKSSSSSSNYNNNTRCVTFITASSSSSSGTLYNHNPVSSRSGIIGRHGGGLVVVSEQRRGLRNLHQNRQTRYKSLVKNQRTYSRKWYLAEGNNNELQHVKGHEREAFESFMRYRMDGGMMPYPIYTSDISKLPPRRRFDYLMRIINNRKGMSAYIKNKTMLQALECFSEMAAAAIGGSSSSASNNSKLLAEDCGFQQQQEQQYATAAQAKNASAQHHHKSNHASNPDRSSYRSALVQPLATENFSDWTSMEQNYFLWLCDNIASTAATYAKKQHSGVASVLRAAAICEQVRCRHKRDEMLSSAEHMANHLDDLYPHARPEGYRVKIEEPWALKGRHCEAAIRHKQWKKSMGIVDAPPKLSGAQSKHAMFPLRNHAHIPRQQLYFLKQAQQPPEQEKW